jgi:hypothetical protein
MLNDTGSPCSYLRDQVSGKMSFPDRAECNSIRGALKLLAIDAALVTIHISAGREDKSILFYDSYSFERLRS